MNGLRLSEDSHSLSVSGHSLSVEWDILSVSGHSMSASVSGLSEYRPMNQSSLLHHIRKHFIVLAITKKKPYQIASMLFSLTCDLKHGGFFCIHVFVRTIFTKVLLQETCRYGHQLYTTHFSRSRQL